MEVDVMDLVAAFRAQERERFAKAELSVQQQKMAESDQRQRALVLLQEVWPEFEKLIKLLPSGVVLHGPQIKDRSTVSATACFELGVDNCGEPSDTIAIDSFYQVSRIIRVWCNGSTVNYRMEHGRHGGNLLSAELPCHLPSTASGLLLVLSKYVGQSLAKLELKKSCP